MAEAVHWGKRGARINTISPGIVMTPLAKDELAGPRGPGYRRMIEGSAAKRAGTPDEVGAVGALLMGPDGGFITGSDFLMDGRCHRRLLVWRGRGSARALAESQEQQVCTLQKADHSPRPKGPRTARREALARRIADHCDDAHRDRRVARRQSRRVDGTGHR
jgi:enoyl-ACP reductase-like protein